jgi:hypothetical protein
MALVGSCRTLSKPLSFSFFISSVSCCTAFLTRAVHEQVEEDRQVMSWGEFQWAFSLHNITENWNLPKILTRFPSELFQPKVQLLGEKTWVKTMGVNGTRWSVTSLHSSLWGFLGQSGWRCRESLTLICNLTSCQTWLGGLYFPHAATLRWSGVSTVSQMKRNWSEVWLLPTPLWTKVSQIA